MNQLGIIGGTAVKGEKIFENCEGKILQNEFGKAYALFSERFIFIPRHGIDPGAYILPHAINHRANLKALKDSGIKEVIGINSTGTLKLNLKPGTIVIPDDFIALYDTPTIFQNTATHITPRIDEDVRRKIIAAAHECDISVVANGTYWQSKGPRFETKAEIRMMSGFADIVGMTMASEAVIAGELELPYATICSVDNYGHGLTYKPLTMKEIIAGAHRNAHVVLKIINKYVERME